MLFNSMSFLIFLPIVTLIYFIIPSRVRYLWLLVTSYYFYMCWNAKYAVLLLATTLITYGSGLIIGQIKKNTLKRWIVAGTIVMNLGILFYFKYTNFAIDTITRIFAKVHIQMNAPVFDIMLPIGISFYTFQALGYVIDVYRDDVHVEKNFFKYALFVSFFPQLLAGPIGRSKKLLPQLVIPKKFNFEEAREGLLLMLWGFFLKIVLADRIVTLVDTVYNDHVTYTGYYLLVATVLFAVQIYCDFYGYSTIALGTAKLLGINLVENFDAPYVSTSVSEFWRKWHMSLTSWFRDYIYIPLGGSRKGKIRKYVNIMIVFLISGLWHGAQFSFLVWGGLNGLYQVIGDMLQPIRDKLIKILHLNRKSLGHKIVQMIGTFVLIDFAWIFFRANGFKDALEVIKLMITGKNPWILFDGSIYTCGLDMKNFWLMIIGIGVLIFADFCKYRKIVIRNVIIKQDYWFRWIFIALTILIILTFGKYGPTYDATNFIYFKF